MKKPSIEFKLSPEFTDSISAYIELSQLLKAANVCSTGGEAKMLIQEGRVKVDGQPESRKGCKIRPGQVVELDDVQIHVNI
jgi:ribosome-associated protein